MNRRAFVTGLLATTALSVAPLGPASVEDLLRQKLKEKEPELRAHLERVSREIWSQPSGPKVPGGLSALIGI